MQGCEVSTRLRYWLTLASGMLECLCFAGVVFGYASLVFVLKEDGYFSDQCVSDPGGNDTATRAGEQMPDKRDIIINIFFKLVNSSFK